MDLHWRTLDIIKIVICLAAVPALRWTGRRPALDRVVLPLLIAVGALAYVNVGTFHPGRSNHSVHYYDMYHYFLGGKYFAELGYYDLYAATVVADQDGLHFFDDLEDFTEIRDLRADAIVPWRDAVADSASIRECFTIERWDAFKRDLAVFQERMPRGDWKEALVDYGFNPSPVWVLTGGLLAHLVGVESLFDILVLAWLDVLLMTVAFCLLGRAFGLRLVAFAVLFFGVNFLHRYQHMSGSLLRLDWLALLVAGLALLKDRRAVPAGICLGWAAMLRAFPALFLVGVALCGIARVYRGGPYLNRELRTVAAAVTTGLVLFAATLAVPPGWSAWTEFTGNISYHTKRLTIVRIAAPYVFMYQGESNWEDVHRERGDQGFFAWRYARYKRAEVAVWLVRLAVLAGFVAVCWRCRAWQALVLGLVLVWGFSNPARYYWCHLVLLVPLLLAAPRNGPREVAAAALFLIMAGAFLIHWCGVFQMGQQWFLSIALGILLIVVMGLVWREEGRRDSGSAD